MGVTFDFISDLHSEWWDEPYDYAAHKTADLVVVGGDLASKTEAALIELAKISTVYKQVLFIDGNHEFRMGAPGYDYNFDFIAVERTLREGIALLPNVTYLLDQAYVEDGVAFIGRNGHWNYRLFPECSFEESVEAGAKALKGAFNEAASFSRMAVRDAFALAMQIERFTCDPDIREIVVTTHTVPRRELIKLSDQFSLAHQNRMGNSYMSEILQGSQRMQLKGDVNNKVKLWLFGHQHAKAEDTVIDGVRYHQNARGFKNDGQPDYKPTRFEVRK